MDVLGDLSVHTCGFSRQVAFELRLNMSGKTVLVLQNSGH